MTKPAGAIRTEAERNLALLAYGLLGVSMFFAGVTALFAVIIAYVLHDAATEELSRHFRAQIRTFWVALVLLIICVLAGTACVLMLIRSTLHHDASSLAAPGSDWLSIMATRYGIALEMPASTRRPAVQILLVASGLAGVAAVLWSMVAPAIGFIRLATSKHLGQTAHP